VKKAKNFKKIIMHKILLLVGICISTAFGGGVLTSDRLKLRAELARKNYLFLTDIDNAFIKFYRAANQSLNELNNPLKNNEASLINAYENAKSRGLSNHTLEVFDALLLRIHDGLSYLFGTAPYSQSPLGYLISSMGMNNGFGTPASSGMQMTVPYFSVSSYILSPMYNINDNCARQIGNIFLAEIQTILDDYERTINTAIANLPNSLAFAFTAANILSSELRSVTVKIDKCLLVNVANCMDTWANQFQSNDPFENILWQPFSEVSMAISQIGMNITSIGFYDSITTSISNLPCIANMYN
jgi:hypothetical protein